MKYLPINKKKRRFYPLRMKTSLRYEKPRYYSVVLRKIIKEDKEIFYRIKSFVYFFSSAKAIFFQDIVLEVACCYMIK